MNPLSAGWARADITPPLGTDLKGYFHPRYADAVHDPLLAKALYLSDGPRQAVLVAVDLCTIDAPTIALAERLTVERHGLPAGSLIVGATHTHLGPHSPAVREALAEGIAAAAAGARDHAAPVTGRAGWGTEATVAFCRRFVMRDGTVRTNPGVRHPDIVCPTVPMDPEIGLVELTADGRRLIIVNYALHLDTIGGTAISADWPYFIETALREALGDGVETLFLQGCCGDINHIDVHGDGPLKGFDMAESIGRRLAAAILAALEGLEPVDLTPFDWSREMLPVELPQPTAAELAAARAVWAGDDRRLTRELVTAGVVVDRTERGPVLPLPVVAARLGEVALAAFPGELFSDYGRRLKALSPGRVTLLSELTGDDIAYVPTPEGGVAGGYESWNMVTPLGTGDRFCASVTARWRRLFGG